MPFKSDRKTGFPQNSFYHQSVNVRFSTSPVNLFPSKVSFDDLASAKNHSPNDSLVFFKKKSAQRLQDEQAKT